MFAIIRTNSSGFKDINIYHILKSTSIDEAIEEAVDYFMGGGIHSSEHDDELFGIMEIKNVSSLARGISILLAVEDGNKSEGRELLKACFKKE